MTPLRGKTQAYNINQSPASDSLGMPYTATRDKDNPRWNDLLDHVNELNDQLVALANFYLGDDVKPPITDDGMLFRATNSIADACSEVTDATCVVAATMRSIICKHVIETKGRAKNLRNVGNDTSELQENINQIAESSQAALSGKGKMERVVTMMEVALSLSKFKQEEDLVHVLECAMSIMKQLAHEGECSNSNEIIPNKNDTNVKRAGSTRTKRFAKHTYRK